MDNFTLSIHVVIIAAAFIFLILLHLFSHDEAHSRPFAKIRLRVDGNRRNRMPDPQQEDDYKTQTDYFWLVAFGLLAIIVVVVQI